MEQVYDSLNSHAIGIVMKELVRRAMAAIRRQRITFEAKHKLAYDGISDDLVTTADAAAQEVFIRSLRECFPQFGIIAEEDDLFIPCTHPTLDIYFTVDPLDGTKAFGRRQSHGVGSMISLVCQGKVIASYIADINTQEIYGYRPDSQKVHRISDLDMTEQLSIDTNRPLANQVILLRDPLPEYDSPAVAELTAHMKSYQIADGSIGVMMARLWKSEVGAVVLRPGHQTPWDATPIIGISRKLGFSFISLVETGSQLVMEPAFEELPKEVITTDHNILVVHESQLPIVEQLLC
jgi:fructose-1,6-bisphosphatase/inositol monophosphatase family enzyme